MLGETIKRARETGIRLQKMGFKGVLDYLKEMFKYWWRILRRSARLFADNRGPYQANTLAYRTMISLIPMLAFMISILTIFMGRDSEALIRDIQAIIQNYLVINIDQIIDQKRIENFIEFIENFITHAKKNSIIGFALLLVTSIFLINAIETIFNNIWHITRRRPYAWRILSFSAMTFLIPTLLGLSIYLTARVSVDQVADMIAKNPVAQYIPFVQLAWETIRNKGIPLALTWALFLAMYKWLPNTRVETYAAMTGSFIAAITFEVFKWGLSYFSFIVAMMFTQKEYLLGGLGAFLIFLMWVYLIWLIILFGAQLAYVIQNYRYVLRINPDLEKRVGETYLACRVMLEIAEQHIRGGQVPSVRELAGKLEVEVPRIQDILSKLMDANLVILGTAPRNRREYEEVFVPGRDLGAITVSEVIRTVNDTWRIPARPPVNLSPPSGQAEGLGPERPLDQDETAEDALDLLLNQSRIAIESDLDVSFRSLVERASG